MHLETLAIDQLPAWIKVNQVELNGIAVQANIPSRGYGLTATAEINGNDAPLMIVPKELVLSLENVWVMAKADSCLRDVLNSLGDYARTARGAILLFLLVQMTHTKNPKVGLATAFTSYIRFLPAQYPIPTFWNSHDRSLLVGTSLEAALMAKLNSLDREFSSLQNATSSIPWCQQAWWDEDTGDLSFEDWKLVDAMYRSRALDLPGTGHAMVPLIDMGNHASGEATVALYDTDHDGNAILLLRDALSVAQGSEITITYGDEKGACEMLFSYGFIEDTMTSAKELFLDLDIPDDDPLKIAKRHISRSPPGFRIFNQEGSIGWEGPFIWLLCVNEEDGLEFKLLQSNDGERELKVFWKSGEVSNVDGLQKLLQADPQWDIFRLRAAVTLRDRIARQLSALHDCKSSLPLVPGHSSASHQAMRLRNLEEELMLHAHGVFEDQINTELLESKVVQQYLGSKASENEPSQEEDFS